MAETVPNWQAVGPTFHQEIRYVTHLRPQPSTIARKGSIRNADTRKFAPPSEDPPSMGPANLTRTLSRAASFKRRRPPPATPCAKFHHFLERLSWNARVKGYPFDQKYLQRQPSFVVTPDRSSYNFSFRSPDLVKRRPQPQAKRTSRPFGAWKNPRPLDVLANNGQVANLPNFLTNVENLRPIDLQNDEYGLRISSGSETNGSSLRSRPLSAAAADPVLTLATEEEASYEDILLDQQEKMQSTKIALPVRPARSMSQSTNAVASANTDASGTSLPTNPLNALKTAEPTANYGSTLRRPRPSRLNLPQSPVPPVQSSLSPINGGLRPQPAGMAPRRPVPTSNSPQTSVRGADLRRSNARRVSAPPAPASSTSVESPHAHTRETGDSDSPTALPSEFKPESWRRSAIIARNSQFFDSDSEKESENHTDLASTWSAYLQRAIAQRVVAQHQRRSAEIRQERQESKKFRKKIDSTSRGSQFSQTSEVPTMFRDSTLSLGSASPFSVVSEQSELACSELAPSIRSMNSSRYTSVVPDSPNQRPRSITSLKSALGAVHSPRALARASQTELARLRRQSMISDAVINRFDDEMGDSLIKTDSNAPKPPPHQLSVTPRRFSQAVENAPQKYVTLFANSRGEQLQSPWQPEASGRSPSVQSATSSSFEVDDEPKFRAKQSELVIRKRPLSVSPKSAHSAENMVMADLNKTPSPSVSPTSAESRRISRLVTEPASAIVRQQSQWRRTSGQKRVKSTGSSEALLHTRQATLESLWGAESSGSE